MWFQRNVSLRPIKTRVTQPVFHSNEDHAAFIINSQKFYVHVATYWKMRTVTTVQALVAVSTKMTVFWDAAPCSRSVSTRRHNAVSQKTVTFE
jgi:hypothetical protein